MRKRIFGFAACVASLAGILLPSGVEADIQMEAWVEFGLVTTWEEDGVRYRRSSPYVDPFDPIDLQLLHLVPWSDSSSQWAASEASLNVAWGGEVPALDRFTAAVSFSQYENHIAPSITNIEVSGDARIWLRAYVDEPYQYTIEYGVSSAAAGVDGNALAFILGTGRFGLVAASTGRNTDSDRQRTASGILSTGRDHMLLADVDLSASASGSADLSLYFDLQLTPLPPRPPQTYAVLIGSQSRNGVRRNGQRAIDMVAEQLKTWVPDKNIRKTVISEIVPNQSKFLLESGVRQLLPKLEPSDTLIYYYMGLGDGTIDATTNVHERLIPAVGLEYFDHELASLLGMSELDDVRKLVILDTCFAGGFWEDDFAGDLDLKHLSNIGVLAGATENTRGKTIPPWVPGPTGVGYFTDRLVDHLQPGVTFADLALHATDSWAGDLTGYVLDDAPDLVTGPQTPVAYFSSDFEPDLWSLDGSPADSGVIPEPSTLIIWSLLGSLGISAGWWRRRRTE